MKRSTRSLAVSKKWLIVVIVALVVAFGAALCGVSWVGLGDFLPSVLAGIVASALTFAIAVILIEGPLMTRERALQRVVAIASRRIAQLNVEIAATLLREIAEYLAKKLDSNIDLYGDERGNWTAFRRLLQAVADDARQVPVKGLPESEPISNEDYFAYVDAAQRFSERVAGALGTDWEVQAQLIDLVRGQETLNARIREARYPDSIRDEQARYARLAAIGDALTDVIEGCPRIEE